MDAAGKDYVMIETVGVGQDEVEIAGLAQVTVVVLVPGMGDDVQAIKAGIMEIADIFVINKADQPGADRVERELQGMLSLGHGQHPPILRTVATEGTGIDGVAGADRGSARDAARPGPRTRRQVYDRPSGNRREESRRSAGVLRSRSVSRSTHRETVDAEKVHVAMLPAGDSRIELLEPSARRFSDLRNFWKSAAAGLHHVALKVPDLAAAVERLRASGARLLNEPRQGAGGHLYVFVHPASTGGVLRTDSGERNLKAEIGIIGGSGLYSMPGFEAQEEAVIETPFGRAVGQLRARHAGGP